jgi:hypothetical protein
MPSTRARFWSMVSVIDLRRLSQSKLTSRVQRLARISAATWLAIARILVLVLADDAELHREATGGRSRGGSRGRAPPGSPARRACSSRSRTASRSWLLLVFTMNWPKFAFTSCWSNGR